MQWSTVGHQKQKEYFEHLVKNGGLAHAYLLVGPEGVGKKMLAEDLKQALVGENHQLDSLELTLNIEAVQQMKTWLALRPVGQHKVVLVDQADQLGREAANTLLKVLEEPPSYAYFFLITSRPGQVMATVASRCELVRFAPLTDPEMATFLAAHKINATDQELLTLVAGGKPGTTLELLQNKLLPQVAQRLAELESVLKAGPAKKLAYAKDLADRPDLQAIVGWWLAWVSQKVKGNPSLSSSGDFATGTQSQNQKSQLASLAHGLLDLSNVLAQSQYNRRLALEQFLLANNISIS